MGDVVWVFFAFVFGGQMVWLIASSIGEKWLRENDPTFQPPGFAARFFIGRLFTAFGPMARYGALRRERGEKTTLVAVFWSGFAVSILSVIGLLVTITSH